MAITQDYILKGGLRSSDEAANNRLKMMDQERIQAAENASKEGISNRDNDAKLAQLIKGKQMRQEAIGENAAAADAWAKQHGLKDGTYSIHPSESGYDIDPRAPMAPGAMLTPAQQHAEGKGGEAVQTYSVSGGAPAMQKNLDNQNSVLGELTNGKRDAYDRAAGKYLSWSPLLMKGLAPTEKARMDKVQGAALGNIRATDNAPTQVLIDQTLSRAYDPAADDSQNIERIKSDYETALARKAQLDQAKDNYDRTGYTTIGSGPTVTRGNSGVTVPPKSQDPLKKLFQPKDASPQSQGPAPSGAQNSFKHAPPGLSPEQFKAWKAQNR